MGRISERQAQARPGSSPQTGGVIECKAGPRRCRGRNGEVTVLQPRYGSWRRHQVGSQVSDALPATCEVRRLSEHPAEPTPIGCARRHGLRRGGRCVRQFGLAAECSTGPDGPARSPAALSRCMRANGVSGFPDPVAGPDGNVGLPLLVNDDGSLTAEGKTFSGPVLRSAEQACKANCRPLAAHRRQIAAAQEGTRGAGVRALHARTRRVEVPRPDVLRRRPGWTTSGDRPAITRVPVRCARVRCRRRPQHHDRWLEGANAGQTRR